MKMPTLLRRVLIGLLWAAAGLVAVTALLWAEEDWRAARDWAEYKRQLASQGEHLDRSELGMVKVPPERNLAATPLLAGLWVYSAQPVSGIALLPKDSKKFTKESLLETMPYGSDTDRKTPADTPTRTSIWRAKATDLPAWQAFYRRYGAKTSPTGDIAQDVLLALQQFDPVLKVIEHAARVMPDGLFAPSTDPVNGGTFKMYQDVQRIVQTLDLQASARLANRQSAAALQDVEQILWLRDATTSEPATLMAQIVGINDLQLSLQPIWEGLAARRWQPAELARLQTRLQQLDLLASLARAFRGERIFTIFMIDHWIDVRYTNRDFVGEDGSWANRFIGWLTVQSPQAWMVQNKVNACRFIQDHVLPALDPPAHRVRMEVRVAADKLLAKIATVPISPTHDVIAVAFPVFSTAIDRASDVQAIVDTAIVACALERFAIDHQGRYPDGLAVLTPQYIERVPSGIVDGTPMRYERTPDRRYALSVRLTDPPVPPEYRRRAAAVTDGRFVWRYPTPPPSAAEFPPS